jgi:hypothetical protein
MATETLPSSDLAKQEGTRFGVGFELTVGDRTFTLEPRALWSADELKQGTFEVALPADDERDIGSFKEFWEQIDREIVELPEVKWDELGDPLDNLAKADVTLREFKLKVVRKKLEQLLLDVKLGTNWDVPGLKQVNVKSLSFVIDVNPQQQAGAAEAPAPPPAPEG